MVVIVALEVVNESFDSLSILALKVQSLRKVVVGDVDSIQLLVDLHSTIITIPSRVNTGAYFGIDWCSCYSSLIASVYLPNFTKAFAF